LAGLAACVAALSGMAPVLLRNHARLWWVWLVAVVVVMVWLIAALTKLNCEEK
jgi:FtsH-binding integral membrane protein